MKNNTLKKQKAPYTMANNELLSDETLFLRDKGLYVFMLSKPDDWKFSIRGLSAQVKEGRDSIATSLKRLIKSGWITRNELREQGKYIRYEYEIHWQKQKIKSVTVSGKSDTLSEKPDTEKRTVSNNYTKKEREGFFTMNEKAINLFIEHLINEDASIRSKPAFKRAMIKRFLDKDESTLVIFEEWKLKHNIAVLTELYYLKKYAFETKGVSELWSFKEIRLKTFDIEALFDVQDKEQKKQLIKRFDSFQELRKFLEDNEVLQNGN